MQKSALKSAEHHLHQFAPNPFCVKKGIFFEISESRLLHIVLNRFL
jgi:hypothetical protein